MTKAPIPVCPTVHYNMGGIPTNEFGQVVTKKVRPPPPAPSVLSTCSLLADASATSLAVRASVVAEGRLAAAAG